MSKKKLSPRNERRQSEREVQKLQRSKEALARLEPGGAPNRPIVVESASQVEGHARSLPCPRCDGSVRVEEHTAETFGDARLRVVRVVCLRCGATRPIYFRIASALPN